MLDVWPALPHVTKDRVTDASVAVANAIKILRDSTRVCQIDLSDLKKFYQR
jgi:hypothetical protein